jgi:hypothetical protein
MSYASQEQTTISIVISTWGLGYHRYEASEVLCDSTALVPLCGSWHVYLITPRGVGRPTMKKSFLH